MCLDEPIWMLAPNGKYSVKSFYQQINFGGVVSVIGDCFWKIKCPQNIHVFIWLVVYNKVLTRDNLAKRRQVDDATCLFCDEPESVKHLFFECVVASHIWAFVSEAFNINAPTSLDDVVAIWRMHKNKPVLCMVTAASLWSLWTLRNDFCFQGRTWKDTRCVLAKLGGFLRQWGVLCDDTQSVLLRKCLRLLDKWRGELLRIAWRWRGVEKEWRLDPGSCAIFLLSSFRFQGVYPFLFGSVI